MFKIEYIIPHQEDYILDLIDADLNHLEKLFKKDLIEYYKKFQNDRSVRVKILDMIKRFVPSATINDMKFDYLRTAEIIRHEISTDIGKDFITIEIDDMVFASSDMISKLINRLFGFDRKGFTEKLKKSLVTEYKIDEKNIIINTSEEN